MQAPQAIKDINRLRHIIDVFVKHGLGYLITETGLHIHLPIHKRIQSQFQKPTSNKVMAYQLRKAFEELGGTFIKFGQLLSLRPDLVPQEFCEEFKILQDNVPPFPFEQAKKIIETEFKKPLNKIFLKFDKKPIASASIAQVYKATLKFNKQIVAVKVQRPNIKEIMNEDIDIMLHISSFLKKRNKFNIDPIEIINEFKRYTERELNFKLEAANAEKIHRNLKDIPSTKIPKMYFDYITEKIIVMEFINGIPISELEKLKQKYPNRKKIIKNYIDSLFQQILINGFFHADSHPANIIIQKDQKIAFIDFGIIGNINPKERTKILIALKCIYEKNKDSAFDAIMSFCDTKKAVNLNKLKEEGSKELNKVVEADHLLGETGPGRALFNVINLCGRYNVKVPIDIVLFSKAFFTMEGTVHELDPTLDFLKEIRSRVEKHFGKTLYIKEFIQHSNKVVEDTLELISNLPEHAEKILERLEDKKEDNSEKILSLEKQILISNEKIMASILIIAFLIGLFLFTQFGTIKFILGLPLPFVIFLVAIALTLIYTITKFLSKNKNI